MYDTALTEKYEQIEETARRNVLVYLLQIVVHEYSIDEHDPCLFEPMVYNHHLVIHVLLAPNGNPEIQNKKKF